MAETPSFEEIVENFELFDSWEDRYRYVIDLGKDMPPLADDQKTSATKVDGCASQVWLVPRLTGERGNPRLNFDGDSDAMIVRGLIAVLRALYNGRPLSEVGQVDAEGQLARLELQAHLSAQRSNGLKAMIARLRDLARAAA
ncbi:MAG: SufE family protein [Pseudomonadota bacterium]